MTEEYEHQVCPWCGEKHKPKKGGPITHPKTGKVLCKCEEPMICVCTETEDGDSNIYCPKCGSWRGCPEW